MTCPYEILGVPRNATPRQVTRAWRAALLAARSGASPSVADVSAAYALVGNAGARAEYDAKGSYRSVNSTVHPLVTTDMDFQVLGARVRVSLATALSGSAAVVPIERWVCTPSGTKVVEDVVEVTMPAIDCDGRGVSCVSGAGHRGPSGSAGDVRVLVEVQPEAGYEFLGDGHVAYHHELQLREALLGFELRYRHPCGRVFDVRAGDQVIAPGHEHRLAGQGLPRADGTRGDVVLVFGVAFPECIGAERRDTLEAALA